jgi:hypothetical protein
MSNPAHIIIYVAERRDDGSIWPINTLEGVLSDSPIYTGRKSAQIALPHLEAALARVRAQAAVNVGQANADHLKLLLTNDDAA